MEGEAAAVPEAEDFIPEVTGDDLVEKPVSVPSDDVPEVVKLVVQPEQPESILSEDLIPVEEPPVEPEKPVLVLSDDVVPVDEPAEQEEEPTTPIQVVQSEDGVAQNEEELTVGAGDQKIQVGIDLLAAQSEDGTAQIEEELTVGGGDEEVMETQGETLAEIDLLAAQSEDPAPPEVIPSLDDVPKEEEVIPMEMKEGEVQETEEERAAETVSKDDEEWVVVDDSSRLLETGGLISTEPQQLPEGEEGEEGEEKEDEEDKEEEGVIYSYQAPPQQLHEEDGEDGDEAQPLSPTEPPAEEPAMEPAVAEKEDDEEGTPTPEHQSHEGPEQPLVVGEGGGGQEPLSPYYEVPVPSQKTGAEVAGPIDDDVAEPEADQIDDLGVPSEDVPAEPEDDQINDLDVPSEDAPAEPEADQINDLAAPSDDEPEADQINDQVAPSPTEQEEAPEEVSQEEAQEQLPEDDRQDYEDGKPDYYDDEEMERLGSSFIPISIQEPDGGSETSSTAAPPTTPPLSMVVERGSPVPVLTESSVTSQDDEQEDFGDRVTSEEGEEEEMEMVDDVQEELPGEASDGVTGEEGSGEQGAEFGGDVMEEEEVVDDVQEELQTTGDEEMTRTADGTEDDGAAGEEGEDGDEGEREEGEEGDEEPPPEDDDGSMQTPIQLQSDHQQGSLLDFDPLMGGASDPLVCGSSDPLVGGASAGPPPQSDPFGMDPLELVTTPTHKAANDIFGHDPFGAAASSSDQSYNPFAPTVAELDPFSMGGQEFGPGGDPPAEGGSLLLGEPLLPFGGGLRPEGEGEDLRDSGVQSPDLLQPEHEGGANLGEPDFGGRVVAMGGEGFESSADPPEDDLLGTPVD